MIDPQQVIDCRRCPRLVAWREEVAATKRAAYRDETYWGRPVPGFGDAAARIVILGLAPAAHGANRTGRVFTGDRTGDFLFAALYRTGFGNQPQSTGVDDGLVVRDAWLTAAVRCAPPANKPTPDERDNCLPWTVAEFDRMGDVRVVVCLGAFAWDAALRLRIAAGAAPVSPKPKFGHGALLGRSALGAARLVSPKPAEHVHRQAHRADARRGVTASPRAGGLAYFFLALMVSVFEDTTPRSAALSTTEIFPALKPFSFSFTVLDPALSKPSETVLVLVFLPFLVF